MFSLFFFLFLFIAVERRFGAERSGRTDIGIGEEPSSERNGVTEGGRRGLRERREREKREMKKREIERLPRVCPRAKGA